MYDYGFVGNCQVSALISRKGGLDWLCMPRPDSEPVFGALLDPDGGSFAVNLVEDTDRTIAASQHYIANTNVLVTELAGERGAIRMTDFCPRFEQYGRIYRPPMLLRIVEKISGEPLVKVACTPVRGWSKLRAEPQRGNSHLRFELGGGTFRVTTNMSLTYLLDGAPVSVREPLIFALSWDLGVEDELRRVAFDFLRRTVDYWKLWVKRCAIPPAFQRETIRSALALKLLVYEDTGAVLAAPTTSLPEECGAARNWDYRFCWLRDAYFVLSALRRLGQFDDTEQFVRFLLDIASAEERLAPVYRLDRTVPLPEEEHPAWRGWEGSVPVRSGNQAAEHIQNDVYGEMLLTLSPLYLDERLSDLRTAELERLMRLMAKHATASIGSVDAGLWEFRHEWQPHAFTDLLCWAGLERVRRVQALGYLSDLGEDVDAALARATEALELSVYEGSVRNGPKDPSFDASLLLLPVVGYPNQELNRRTVEAILKGLGSPKGEKDPVFLYRYVKRDDLGVPSSAFVICSFWMIEALARVGHFDAAQRTMNRVNQAANHLGLYSEHFDPRTGIQLGNFPQGYSHVGQINAAFSLSPSWDAIL